jgi:hypothetical protein
MADRAFKIIGAALVLGATVHRVLTFWRRQRSTRSIPNLLFTIRNNPCLKLLEEGKRNHFYTDHIIFLSWTEHHEYVFRDTACLDYIMPILQRLNLHQHQPESFKDRGFVTVVFRRALGFKHWEFALRWFNLFSDHCSVDEEDFHFLLDIVYTITANAKDDDMIDLPSNRLYDILHIIIQRTCPRCIDLNEREWRLMLTSDLRFHTLIASIAYDDGSGFQIESILIPMRWSSDLNIAKQRRLAFPQIVGDSLALHIGIPPITKLVLEYVRYKKSK